MTYEPMDISFIKEINSLWNRIFDSAYWITEQLLNQKLFYDSDYFAKGSFICRDKDKTIAFIASKISNNTLPEYKSAGWISLFVVDNEYQGNGIGKKLYQMAESEFKKAGINNVIISGEMRNFFSGIPQPTALSIDFFKKAGFILNDSVHYDLTNDLSKTNYSIMQGKINTDTNYVTAPAKKDDFSKLSDFLKAEFPGRWEFEVLQSFSKGNEFEHVLLLWNKDKIKGFCRIRYGDDTDGIEAYMGKNCGALGPIGIAKDIRGERLGKRILYDSLVHLQELGAHKTNIDWTVLIEYYGDFGFTPWRIYLYAYKKLG